MKPNLTRILVVVALLPLTLVACSGGNNPAGASQTATIRGTVNAGAGTSTSSASVARQSVPQITITVMGTSISTTTDSQGTFVLTGVPTGTITLRFQGRGMDATLVISGLAAGQTMTISVQVSGSHASRDDDNDDDNGSQPSPSPSPAPSPTPPPPGTECVGVGQHAEVEGNVSEKGATDITVHQNGHGDFLCIVSSSTRIRHGNKTFTFDQLQVGDHVHVTGTGLGAVNGSCQVQADEIKIQ